jgi:hypothetical protein
MTDSFRLSLATFMLRGSNSSRSDSAKNVFDTEIGVLQVKLETSDAKIKILNEELAKQNNKQPTSFWFGVGVTVGVVGGILLTSFAVYAVNQASR